MEQYIIEELEPEIRRGLELSLEYVYHLYKIRDEIRLDRKKYDRIFRTLDILHDTKKKIEYVLRRVSDKDIQRYKYLKKHKDPFKLTKPEKEEIEKFKKDYFKINIHKKLYELINEVDNIIYSNPHFNSLIPIHSSFSDFYDQIPKIRIYPEKLLFNIWHKAFRKGKYRDNKSIVRILFEFKEKTKGTEKEFLFNSINENTNFETLRKKSCYNNAGKKKFYDKLAGFIYQKSFIEKISSFST